MHLSSRGLREPLLNELHRFTAGDQKLLPRYAWEIAKVRDCVRQVEEDPVVHHAPLRLEFEHVIQKTRFVPSDVYRRELVNRKSDDLPNDIRLPGVGCLVDKTRAKVSEMQQAPALRKLVHEEW
jgi:hypothetical protein